MGFLDSISKTLSSGVDRAKFEADKFQRTSRISGEVNNIKSQIDTNVRQLGERALELYQQGAITAPEIASLAQIIAQLREQQTQKETELNDAQAETFEAWQASQPQQSSSSSQNVPISNESASSYSPPSSGESTPGYTTHSSGESAAGYGAPSSGESAGTTSMGTSSSAAAPSFTGRTYDIPESTDMSGSGMPNASSVGGQPAVGSTPYACPNCGYSVPETAAFCPNCGSRVARS